MATAAAVAKSLYADLLIVDDTLLAEIAAVSLGGGGSSDAKTCKAQPMTVGQSPEPRGDEERKPTGMRGGGWEGEGEQEGDGEGEGRYAPAVIRLDFPGNLRAACLFVGGRGP